MNISFSTTAVARPAILERTYSSFQKNLGVSLKEFDLVINVDPLPQPKKVSQVIDVARSFFRNVKYRAPKSANFADAVRWCWTSADSDLLFHLEDDWELCASTPLEKLVNKFNDPQIITLVLRAYNHKYTKIPLSPTIHRRELYQKVRFDISLNPEIQLRHLERFGIRFTHSKNIKVYPSKIIVRDIGRRWMRKTKYRKPDKKVDFTTWTKK